MKLQGCSDWEQYGLQLGETQLLECQLRECTAQCAHHKDSSRVTTLLWRWEQAGTRTLGSM